MKKTFLFFVPILFVMGCRPTPKVDLQAERKAILNLEDQWTLALQASDAEKIMQFYAPDAVVMMANKPIMRGLEEIRKANSETFADTTLLFSTYSGRVDTIIVSASGDLAYALGRQEMTVKTTNGKLTDKGKWVDVWRKIDGIWRVVVSTGTSDMPVHDVSAPL